MKEQKNKTKILLGWTIAWVASLAFLSFEKTHFGIAYL